MKLKVFLILILLGLIACSSGQPTNEATPPSANSEATQNETEVAEEPAQPETVTPIPTIVIEDNENSEPTDTAVQETDDDPSPTATTEQPSISKEEQLIASFSNPSETNGEVLILLGQVLDVNGEPVSDTAVEIWQTDSAGVYDHPRDPTTEDRDLSFQFYGTAVTDSEGYYVFRTITPGEYEPRPRHIHFKVVQNGSTVLTSQFYFSDDIAQVENEGMFVQAGDSGDLLLLQLVQGDGMLLANGRIVIDTGIGNGQLPLTPAQGEGPYYPVVELPEYDNDLTTLP